MIIVLLDSMWGWGGFNEAGEEAPRSFKINPDNFSGRRLYRLCGNIPFRVTNSCRFVQCSANRHGKPDPEWVGENLESLMPFQLLLVCGKIAMQTYKRLPVLAPMQVMFIDHPAARRWTNAKLDSVAQEISQKCHA